MRRHGGGGFWVRVETYIYKYLDGTTRCGFGGIQSSGLVYGVSDFFLSFFFGVTYTEPYKLLRTRGDIPVSI